MNKILFTHPCKSPVSSINVDLTLTESDCGCRVGKAAKGATFFLAGSHQGTPGFIPFTWKKQPPAGLMHTHKHRIWTYYS